jgi:hypothetical protein
LGKDNQLDVLITNLVLLGRGARELFCVFEKKIYFFGLLMFLIVHFLGFCWSMGLFWAALIGHL